MRAGGKSKSCVCPLRKANESQAACRENRRAEEKKKGKRKKKEREKKE